jgi:hypothetical protein
MVHKYEQRLGLHTLAKNGELNDTDSEESVNTDDPFKQSPTLNDSSQGAQVSSKQSSYNANYRVAWTLYKLVQQFEVFNDFCAEEICLSVYPSAETLRKRYHCYSPAALTCVLIHGIPTTTQKEESIIKTSCIVPGSLSYTSKYRNASKYRSRGNKCEILSW